uniref:T9SS type A sorting domain-containing protein n=1 Tax=candidate division WOR-3 bacterium TaxID=2052148 RepID=A0A7C4TC79_UNCW3
MNILILCLLGATLIPNPLRIIKDWQRLHLNQSHIKSEAKFLNPWNWNFTGPEGGEILFTMGNPNASNLAFAFSATDVWRSTDGGANWSLCLEECSPQGGVMCTPSRGIIVDGNGTVWVTLNGGADWAEVLYTNDFQCGSFEVIDTVVYLVDSFPPRLWCSTNSGLSWQVVQTFNQLDYVDIVAHSKSSPTTFYLIGHKMPDDTLAYIYYSPAGNFVDTILAGEVRDFQVSPYNPNLILITTDNGIYQALSASGPWNLIAEPYAFGLFQPLDIEFNGNDSIIVSSYFQPGIFTGRRQFGVWVFNQVESREIGTFISPAGNGIFYCGSLGKGVFKSTNNGISWPVMRHNLYAHTLISFGNASAINNTTGYFIGLGGTPYRTQNWGGVWDTLGVNFLLFGSAIEFAPTNPNFIITSAMDIKLVGTNISSGTIFRSTDNGQNWEKVDSTYLVNDFLITNNPNIIVGISDNVVIRSTAGGIGFSQVLEKQSSFLNLVGLDTIFVATDDSTFVSYDRGANWAGLVARGGELAYDNTRKILYIAGEQLYRYNLNTLTFDSLPYYPITVSVSPNGNLYFLHYVSPDLVLVARSFDGGNTIEQETFPISIYWSGGLRAGNAGVFYYQPARGFWCSNDITQMITEDEEIEGFKEFSIPAVIRRGTKLSIESTDTKPSFYIFDICGRIAKRNYWIKKESDRYLIQCTTEDLNSGVYFLLLNNGRGNWVKKIIIY